MPLRCSLDGPVTRMLPNASTVPGWQVAQLVNGRSGVWAASLGGMPWQLPQLTCPDEVQRGRAGPWQDAVAQVSLVRSQPRLATTCAGPAWSRWPGAPTVAGTT